VETAHRLIEDEFYKVERFTSRADFLWKAGAYNLWFNVARRNRGKEHKTPLELIREKEPGVESGGLRAAARVLRRVVHEEARFKTDVGVRCYSASLILYATA
jgi:hypothetical protein